MCDVVWMPQKVSSSGTHGLSRDRAVKSCVPAGRMRQYQTLVYLAYRSGSGAHASNIYLFNYLHIITGGYGALLISAICFRIDVKICLRDTKIAVLRITFSSPLFA